MSLDRYTFSAQNDRFSILFNIRNFELLILKFDDEFFIVFRILEEIDIFDNLVSDMNVERSL